MPHSRSTPARSYLRPTLVTAALTSFLAASVVLAPSAQAAWTTGMSNHGGKVQVCKVPLGGGDLKIRVRLDNRRANHAHIGYVFRNGDGRSTTAKVRAAAGKWSGTKSLRVNRGDVIGVGIDETTVGGLGDMIQKSAIPRC